MTGVRGAVRSPQEWLDLNAAISAGDLPHLEVAIRAAVQYIMTIAHDTVQASTVRPSEAVVQG